MVGEDHHETSSGWPLGLEIMNMRLRVIESSQAALPEPYSLREPSLSFSSFSSSNLETESSASFFQDHSVSLGRLIGIRSGEGNSYFSSRIHPHEGERTFARSVSTEVSKRRGVDMSQGICIPLLFGTLEKMSRSKSR
ncbi:hypothetical protein K2173_000756 [Erythroxylum novogranatense]|uniref:Uncharacterized protein n=1 Tax=Erythroxylum novogranatense TaxID=1862640 RepID=A0AAV8T2V4_9ROSI|nr:hypothetical protein K2173_000756 [Erythroxylum novogranatense]